MSSQDVTTQKAEAQFKQSVRVATPPSKKGWRAFPGQRARRGLGTVQRSPPRQTQCDNYLGGPALFRRHQLRTTPAEERTRSQCGILLVPQAEGVRNQKVPFLGDLRADLKGSRE